MSISSKSNRVEVYSFNGESLNLRTSFTIYGRISGILDIHPTNSPTSHLVIATDKQDYFTVSWDSEQGAVRTERSANDVADKFLRDALCGPLYRADPAGRMLGFHVYEGSFLAVQLVTVDKKVVKKKGVAVPQVGDLQEHSAIRMPNLKVVDVAFLHGEETPVLGVLHRDGNPDCTQFVSYKVINSAGSCEFEKFSLEAKDLEAESKLLLPVAEPMGGVVVIGEAAITYIGGGKENVKIAIPDPLVVHAWAHVDQQRILLGDELGQLKVLLLEVVNGQVVGMKLEIAGTVRLTHSLISVHKRG